MSFSWEDLLSLAEELAEAPSGDGLREAKHRSAISRAYYAAYHRALNYYRVKHRGLPPRASRGGGWHEALCEALRDSADAVEQEVGDLLTDLKGNRHDADYKARVLVTDLMVIASLLMAREIISRLA